MSNTEEEMKGYKIALVTSSLYISIMLIVGLIAGDAFNNKVGDILFSKKGSISIKYTGIITIGGVFIFIVTCWVIKRFNKYIATIKHNLNQIKEKEEAIKKVGKSVNKQRELIGNVLESASIFIITLDENFNMVSASKNIKDIINLEVKDIKYKPLCIIIDRKYVEEIKEQMQGEDSYELEIEFKSKHDKRIYTYGTIKRIINTDEETRYNFVLYDISKRKNLQQKITYLDSYDSLTDLPNRNLMENIFTSLLPKIHGDGNPGAMLFIDIDNFAFINETKGHHAGDQLLIDMAGILRGLEEEGDIIGRITQDKFVMIITGEETIKDIDKKINKVMKSTHIEWKFEENEYMISTTVGVSLYPKDGLDFISLLKKSNLALECSKEGSRTSYEYYNENKKCLTIKDLSIVTDVQTALKEGQFEMHYQPIYNLQTEEIENVESLIRWYHPEKGYISPDTFIPAAERSWIIDDIGEYTLEEVFRQKVEWNKRGCELQRISVNISAISFSKPKFGEYIEEKLERYGLDGKELVLELTETGFSTHQTRIKINVEYLRKLGIRISMDDFGTGYSSLTRLRELEIDDIKLDRTFVVSLLEENGQEIIKTLISLAAALGKDVVSEGIETEEQCNILRELGSKYGQGYFLSRPMPAEDLVNHLKNKG